MTKFIPLKECKILNGGLGMVVEVEGLPIPKYLKHEYNKWWNCMKVNGIVIANNGDEYVNWHIAKWHPHCLIIYFRRLIRYFKIKKAIQ